MAQNITVHFERHRREARLNRRRFSGGLLALLVVASVAMGMQFRGSEAATTITISGKVTNGSTGSGVPNVALALCGNSGTIVTNSTGAWTYAIPAQGRFCVRYQSGAPAGTVQILAINSTQEKVGSQSYEYQVAGYKCYHNASVPAICDDNNRVWDRSIDTANDIKFVMATPVPTPVPTPIPTPKPTPKPTPRPIAIKTPVSTPAPTTPVPAAVATPTPTPTLNVGAPTAFSAVSSGETALVSLSWSAPTEVPAGSTYQLNRSLDGVTWQDLAQGLTTTSYQDGSVAYGVHYFYRLRTLGSNGVGSDYALADARTSDFINNTGGNGSTTFTSEDGRAGVSLESGTFARGTQCNIQLDSSYKPSLKSGYSKILGPYVLMCKTQDGASVESFAKPAKWSLNIKDKLGSLQNPQIFFGSDGGATQLNGTATYIPNTSTITFEQTTATRVLVLASKAGSLPVNFIFFIFIVLAVMAALATLILRRKQKVNYDDYLRSKYYNL